MLSNFEFILKSVGTQNKRYSVELIFISYIDIPKLFVILSSEFGKQKTDGVM